MSSILIKIGPKIYNATYDELTGDYSIGSEASQGEDRISGERTFNIVKKDTASNDTNVSIDEVYNQLLLTCDLQEIDQMIESPTDEDVTYSPFQNKQLYATEYAAFGEGQSAMDSFKEMILTGNSNWDGRNISNHYVQVYKSKVWDFSGDKYISEDGTQQHNVLNHALDGTGLAFLVGFSSEEPKSPKDDTVKKPESLQRYLCITCNGNLIDDETSEYPNETALKNSMPLATYKGNLSGGVFSPTDDATTNYIVISGHIYAQSALQRNSLRYPGSLSNWIPIGTPTVPTFQQIRDDMREGHTALYRYNTVHLDNDKNGDGAYYAVKFYNCQTPHSNPVENLPVRSLIPLNKSWKSLTELNYNYQADGDETDKIKKMQMVACTLKIGDKYACEEYDSEGNSVYKWRTLDECKYVTYNGESYPQNQIFLGANIAIDDPIVGKEYPFANSVLPEYNIDAEGIAIPVNRSDALSGEVSFTIDGLVNNSFDEITRRHPTFFRSTKWYHNTKRVLSHVQNIFIRDFKMEIFSNNANINNLDADKDLVYYTEELKDYIEKKDDIEFKISTALTTEECQQKGITNKVLRSTPFIGDDPLREIYNTVSGFSGKPEEQYLDDYWPEYSSPHQIVEKTVYDDSGRHWDSLVKLDEFSFTYQIIGQASEPLSRHTTLTLRQI